VTPGGSLRYGAVGGVPLARNESIEHITLANGTVGKEFLAGLIFPRSTTSLNENSGSQIGIFSYPGEAA
jgi:hypothetical protein